MDSLKCLASTHIFTLVCLHFVPWFPFSLSMGYIAAVNHMESMTGNQRMIHDFWLRHLYSRDGTCTSGNLCRRPPSFVAFHICYLLDRSSIHDISALVIMIPVFPMYIRYLHPSWRSWSIVYCAWRWPHMTLCISCLFMAIVLLCIGIATCICSHMQRLIIVLY